MDANLLRQWFEHTKEILENAYVAHSDSEPWRQSVMSGPEERWISLRKPIIECLHRSGSFLDIGCANGYLLECILKWADERRLQIDPYGVDISPRLVEMARRRLPEYAEHIFEANSYEWTPPIKFDYVRTELVYVPAEYERAYVEAIFTRYLKPDGRLILAGYMEGLPDPERGCLPGSFATNDILSHLKDLHLQPIDFKDGYDSIKDRRTRFAILTREGLE